MQFRTISVIDLYAEWAEATYSDADAVICWHDDSEVIGLQPVNDTEFELQYADGSYIITSGYTIITVQSIIWKDNDNQV